MPKLVSIIMPIYDVEKYLERSINCVIKQTYHELQIILVDDGSNDGSGKICDEFAKRDERIVVVHKVNGGLSDARNVGLREAKGEYVYFFDPDDYIELDLIEKCVCQIEVDHSDFVVFNYKCVKNDIIVKESDFRSNKYILRSSNERWKFVCDRLLKYMVGWEAWSRFFSSDFIKRNDLIFWNNNEIFAEDLAYMIAAVFCAEKISVIDEYLYYYVLREDSILGKLKKVPINKFISLAENIVERRELWNIELGKAEVIGVRVILNELDKCKKIKQLSAIIEDITENKRKELSEWVQSILIIERFKGWECWSLKILRALLNRNIFRNQILFLFFRKINRVLGK